MSSRTAGANRAIREAWENEKRLVLEGKGTRDWTDEQQRQIHEKGKAYDDLGRAFEGQHMKSVSAYPEYQGDARNIQLLSREEHLAAHRGNWQNPTNGYYYPALKTMSDFGDGPPQPCPEVPPANPRYAEPPNDARPQTSGAGSKGVDALASTTAAPKGNLRQLSQTVKRFGQRVWERRSWLGPVAVIGLGVAMDAANRSGDRTAAPTTQPSARTTPEPGDDSLRETRQSPEEHDVSGYTKKDGTNVRSYRRGSRKD